MRDYNLHSGLTIKRLSNFLLFNTVNTNNKSERIMNLLNLLGKIMFNGKSMVQISALKIETF